MVLQEKSCSELSRENGRLREEVGSLNIKVKWAQNKLKSETDTHKVDSHHPHHHRLTLSHPLTHRSVRLR